MSLALARPSAGTDPGAGVVAQADGQYHLFAPGIIRSAPAIPPTQPPGVSGFEVYFIDVGQGDATLIIASISSRRSRVLNEMW